MNTTYLRRVRALFANDLTPRRTTRHNMRAWVRMVRILGDNWLLSQANQQRRVTRTTR